jgi:tRNA dimethylallyltransferase
MDVTPVINDLVNDVPAHLPVLIAGPTASGKSALALALAEAQGGVIVNADASQVYDCWRVLTARPSPEEEARAAHRLYGHVAYDDPYSTGYWLRDVTPLLKGPRPIIVGGTGLYFSALTEGFADIPPIPPEVRAEADAMSSADMLSGIDTITAARIDTANPARIQRAWEVQCATGKGLAAWQDETPAPILAARTYTGIVMDSPKDWLTPRIKTRFDEMLRGGALDEARAMADRFDARLPSCRAIGAAEAMAVLDGRMSHDDAVAKATIATRQYAKRQRTWFRARMSHWRWVASDSLSQS